jgi:hypothetical protein
MAVGKIGNEDQGQANPKKGEKDTHEKPMAGWTGFVPFPIPAPVVTVSIRTPFWVFIFHAPPLSL